MNPKDKAKEIVDKFTMVGLQRREEGKQCALIAVDLLFESAASLNVRYWNTVKKEIEKL